MGITKESSRSFVTFYIIVSTVLLAGCIRSFNASLQEVDELDRFEERLCQLADLDSTLLKRKLPSNLTKERAILEILCHIGDLNYDLDVKTWDQVSLILILNSSVLSQQI